MILISIFVRQLTQTKINIMKSIIAPIFFLLSFVAFFCAVFILIQNKYSQSDAVALVGLIESAFLLFIALMINRKN